MSKTILLVDDQEIERTALRTILATEPSWIVTEAGDGYEALDQLCSKVHPQLCVVDLRMPKVDGLEFLRRVRRDPDLRGIKVIITSATRDRNSIIELAKLGIDGYILKPFQPEKTMALIRPVMDALPDPDETPHEEWDLLTKVAMVIDDDAVGRTALTALVKAEPHWNVIEVNGGRAAIDKLSSGKLPDLCFLDLQMPEMDGMAVLAAIRSNPKLTNLRVAVTSGERDREKIRELARMRIETYLLKPLDATKVRAALRAMN